MALRDLMQTNVLTLTTGKPASDAWAVMTAEHVRHAVVMLGDLVVGVVSDRDLGGPNGAPVRRGRTVADLMHPDPVVASPDMLVEDAVALVRERHVGCLPVTEDGRLVGIVTRSDLLATLDPHRAEPPHEPPPRGAADVPRPPLVASPNAAKR